MSIVNRLYKNIVLPVGAIDKKIIDNVLLVYTTDMSKHHRV